MASVAVVSPAAVVPGAGLEVALVAVREAVRLALEALPYFVVGAAAAGALEAFLPARWAGRAFGGRGFRALVPAVVAGAVLPGCACATMPLAVGLRGSGGARLGTLAAFIFVSPLLSPVTVALTWGMLGGEMAVARVVAAVVGSLALGVIVERFERWFGAGRAAPAGLPVACGRGPGEGAEPRPLRRFAHAFVAGVRRVGPYFLLGMAVAGVLAALLPPGALARLGGGSGAVAYALAAVVGIPLYVCEGEEVPLTYALVARGLGSGPAFTFLLGSVGTCVPTLLMAQRVIGRRATAFYGLFWLAFAVLAGLAFAWLAG